MLKAIAFNGSPRRQGNTWYALNTVLTVLEENGIQTELVQIGDMTIQGCKACGGCSAVRNGKCVLDEDAVNTYIQRMQEADGILLGSPVYFAGPTGPMKAFLDRAFFVCSNNGGMLRHKVGAAVTAVRRAGGIQALDALNRYLMYSEMLLPSSNYWSLIYGRTPGQAAADAEGVQTLRLLGENMAWLMKLTAQGRSVLPPPSPVEKCMTNFIR